jgi:acyl phosphate:glycerol-3-phosphate acyltransferase
MIPELASPAWALLAAALASYLLGSIPFGLVITRLLGMGDVRQIGSGNIGATNVLRTGNRFAAAATLALDAGKGALAVLIARWWLGEDAAQVAALTSFLGHLYPIWLGFRGGKGVATFFGTLLALAWPVGLMALATWIVIAALGRRSSLAALVSVAVSPVLAWFMTLPTLILVLLVMAQLVFVRHRTNIARLLDGTEPRIGKRG